MSLFLTESECGDGVMDLVFVIDGSKSLGPANFELVKQFVNGIVDSLDISRTGTHVGLLQYSTKVRTEFTLGQYTTAQGIRQAVSRMQYMGRGSMTGSALRHMFEFSFSAKEGARPSIPRVSIVFTDGRSQDDVSEWANKAKNSGTLIIIALPFRCTAVFNQTKFFLTGVSCHYPVFCYFQGSQYMLWVLAKPSNRS